MAQEYGTIKLRVDKLPDLPCYPAVNDLVSMLPALLSGRVEGNFSDVVVSNQTPSIDDRAKLWVRIDENRNFIGFLLYQEGDWKTIYPTFEGQLFFFNSAAPLSSSFKEIGRIKTEDIKATPTGNETLPSEIVIATYIGN
jgi:hypothetical protein